MNLNQLKALDAVEQSGSFSGAAGLLGLTQPAVSIQLRQLQAHCGVKLFWRCGRQLEFSSFGRELVRKARTILGLIDDLEASLDATSKLCNGRLDIGLSCHYFVMDLLAVFMERYPGVQVKAKIGDSAKLIEDVIACRLDIAGVTGLEPDNRLVNIAYRDQPIILFVARNHPWARHVGISAAELNDQPMVARHGSSMTRRIFESRLNDRNIHPRILIELDSWEAMKAATAAGIGFGIALEDEFGHDDRLVGITLTDVDLSARQYFVCLPEFEQLRSVQAFLDVVRELQRPIVGQRGSFSAEAIADRDPVALPSYYSPHCIFPLPMTCFNKENPK